jgi:hypothetical protein
MIVSAMLLANTPPPTVEMLGDKGECVVDVRVATGETINLFFVDLDAAAKFGQTIAEAAWSLEDQEAIRSVPNHPATVCEHCAKGIVTATGFCDHCNEPVADSVALERQAARPRPGHSRPLNTHLDGCACSECSECVYPLPPAEVSPREAQNRRFIRETDR